MMKKRRHGLVSIAVLSLSLSPVVFGQDGKPRGPVKPVTVPVTIRIRDSKPVEMRIVDYLLREDGEMQTILSARTPNDNPLTLAVLLQDDLESSVSVEARTHREHDGGDCAGRCTRDGAAGGARIHA